MSDHLLPPLDPFRDTLDMYTTPELLALRRQRHRQLRWLRLRRLAVPVLLLLGGATVGLHGLWQLLVAQH